MIRKLAPRSACLACFLTAASAFGQTPPPPTPPNQQQNPQQRPPQQSPANQDETPRVLFLNGRVVMADGAPLPDHLQIDLVCQSQTIEQTHVRKGGVFSFELGSHRQSGFMDASASRSGAGGIFGTDNTDNTFGGLATPGSFRSAGLGRVDLTGCEVRLPAMPGYHSDPLMLGRISVFDSNIGTIYLQPLAEVKGTSVSAKTLAAPKDAKKALEKGLKELRNRKVNYEKARVQIEKAVEIYPDYAEAWNLLGEIRTIEKDLEGAMPAFDKAIRVDPDYIPPYLGLARLRMAMNHWQEAARISNKVVELNPYLAQGRYFHALSHFQIGSFTEAEASLKLMKERSQTTQYPMMFYLLGAIHANRGEYTQAAQELNEFLKSVPESDSGTLVDNARRQLDDWEQRGLIANGKKPATP